MTWAGLLAAGIITAIIVWLCNQNKIPEPFQWVVFVLLVVLWLIVLLVLFGYGGFLSRSIGA